jgi:hypothetical protein
MNKNIVILGCPRSGTSLVAHLTKSAGYDADKGGTKTLMKPNKDFNPDGYFERLDIVKANDALIRLINPNYNFLNSPSLNEVTVNTKTSPESIALSNDLKSYDGWFIKDSRLCFTLNLYGLENISVIKVQRSPQSAQQSMMRHYGNIFEHDTTHGPHVVKKINFEEYYKNINECIYWQMSRFPNITVTYEDVVDGNIEALENFLESKVDKAIINPKYRNYAV